MQIFIKKIEGDHAIYLKNWYFEIKLNNKIINDLSVSSAHSYFIRTLKLTFWKITHNVRHSDTLQLQ